MEQKKKKSDSLPNISRLYPARQIALSSKVYLVQKSILGTRHHPTLFFFFSPDEATSYVSVVVEEISFSKVEWLLR